MEILQITVLGRRSYFNMISGSVEGLTQRKARRKTAGGRASGPVLSVSEFWIKDSSSSAKQLVEAVPEGFAVRNGQAATVLFSKLDKKGQRLLAVRNNASGKYLILPPGRPFVVALLMWLAVGWVGFWVSELALVYTHKPTLSLFFLFIWLVGGLWTHFHGRGVQRRLRQAVAGGPSQLALLIDR